jgi:DNA polymerase-4
MPKLSSFRAKREVPQELGAEARLDGTHILHVDMDAFFVSVELLDRPDLRGKPVVVGGQPDQRGVVSAASYEARRFGIQSAMPLRTAGRLCPHAVFLEPRHERYSEWSDRIAAILARYSPRVEMASVDEAYLDLAGTERLLGHPLAAAHRLRQEIWKKTGLPSSIGLARTRLVAKVASDQAKPAGLLWIPAGSEAAFLALLSVRKIPGIGKVTEGALNGLGIETVAQLAAVPRENLEEVFGRWGSALYRKARGEDTYEFLEDAEAKSISHNHTFSEDVDDLATIESTLSHLCQKAAKRLRDAGLFAGTITLTLRYAGFETITRARTLPAPTDLDQDVQRVTRELLARHRDPKRRVRLVGVSLTSLSHGEKQLELLDPARREKLEKLARASDQLRERFGFDKVQLGGSVGKPPRK